MALTIKQIADALEISGGYVTVAAKKLGVTYQAVSYRIKKNKGLQDIKKSLDEYYLDLSESELIKAVKRGESWAICFHLKCKGKNRGYVERQEISQPDGETFNITVSVDDD